MTGSDPADRAARDHRSPALQTFGRASDAVRLDRALERALTDGPVLLVLGGRRMVLCLERDLPGAENHGELLGTVGDGPIVSTPRHGSTVGARAEDLDVTTTVLTPRELQIAQLAATGQRPAQIAVTLGIAPQTVRVHLHSVRSRCRAASVPDALAALARHHSWPTRPPLPETVAGQDGPASPFPDRRVRRRPQRSPNPAPEGPPAGSP